MDMLWWYREESCSPDIAAIDLAHHYYALARLSMDKRAELLSRLFLYLTRDPYVLPLIDIDAYPFNTLGLAWLSRHSKLWRYGASYIGLTPFDESVLRILLGKVATIYSFTSFRSSLWDSHVFATYRASNLIKLLRCLGLSIEPEAISGLAAQIGSKTPWLSSVLWLIDLESMALEIKDVFQAIAMVGIIATLKGIDMWCVDTIDVYLAHLESGRCAGLETKLFNFIENAVMGMEYVYPTDY